MDALSRIKAKFNERYKTNEMLIFTALEAFQDFQSVAQGNAQGGDTKLSIPILRIQLLKQREETLRIMRELVKRGDNAQLYQSMLDAYTGEGAQMMIEWEVFSVAWGSLACPRVKLTQEQAAQFIISSISPEKSEMLKTPWDTFVVEFPKNLITFKNSKVPGGIDTIERVMVMAEENYYWEVLIESVGYRTSYLKDTIPNLIKQTNSNPDSADMDDRSDYGNKIPTDEVNAMSRAAQAAARIALCTVIELQSPENFKHQKTQHVVSWKKPELRKRYPKPVFSNQYSFGKAVQANSFRAAKEYLSGNGAQQQVRTLVRGFYRNQPWGPASSLRKWIYVDWFWRNKNKEITNVKPHKI